MEEEICPDSGMKREDCPCMWCSPPAYFFKYMVADVDIQTIDDVIRGLEKRKQFFEKLKRQGFRLSHPIDDHFAELEPPESEDYYWARCRSSGCYLKMEKGEPIPEQCPTCGENVLEFEK